MQGAALAPGHACFLRGFEVGVEPVRDTADECSYLRMRVILYTHFFFT
jgi:hypothetical protein